MKNKAIILIHGIGYKPEKEAFQELWFSTILKNLSIENENLDLEQIRNCFEMFYWADYFPQENRNPSNNIAAETQESIEKVLQIRNNLKENYHAFPDTNMQESPYFMNEKIVFCQKIMNEIIEKNYKVITHYFNNKEVREKIQTSLMKLIKKYWEEGKEIMLITHSFGSIIAYEALWALNDFGKKVQYFVNIASPMAYEGIMANLNSAVYGMDDIRFYPKTIENWHSYVCYNDLLTFNVPMKKLFFDFMKEHNLLKDYRQYTNLYNPYVNKRNQANYHKSFGYLTQPKLAKWIIKFLQE